MELSAIGWKKETIRFFVAGLADAVEHPRSTRVAHALATAISRQASGRKTVYQPGIAVGDRASIPAPMLRSGDASHCSEAMYILPHCIFEEIGFSLTPCAK